MVSSCNQIKRDSWSMNLCVETALNVLTTLREGGAAGGVGGGGLSMGTGAAGRSSPAGLAVGPASSLQRGRAANGL